FEADQADDRAKDFLACETGRILHGAEDGRLDEEAFAIHARAAGEQRHSRALAKVEIAENFFKLRARGERAELRCRIERVARAKFAPSCDKKLCDLIEDAPLHEDARA